MKSIVKTLSVIVLSVTIFNCIAQKKHTFKAKEVYKSKDLIINQIAENSFQHISFLQTNDFGNVPCNGLIVRNSNEAVIFDTPSNDKSSEELIKWVKESLHCKINAIIPTHFHNDCLGGLKIFHASNIPSYAYFKTIELAKENNYTVPENSFTDSLVIKMGKQYITARFFGEGHTRDNVIGYFPADNVMFGGCLIKEVDATKGYLGDANTAAWSGTVENIKKQYPNVKIVIPGHGEYGNVQLLDYTIKLFRTQ
ncbi:subclass B1 metallo-beta-lactamase [Emticicia sp. 17c]|uniref:subclass B1 metallo-beta-lactamase n=1 Tax=Emticicia sp. 17c TaxID=3127704 RepID=UPI00301D3FB6